MSTITGFVAPHAHEYTFTFTAGRYSLSTLAGPLFDSGAIGIERGLSGDPTIEVIHVKFHGLMSDADAKQAIQRVLDHAK